MQTLQAAVFSDPDEPEPVANSPRLVPLSEVQKKMIQEHVAKSTEAGAMKNLGVQHWVRDVSYLEAEYLLEGQPTINIEGLVAGYTGPGGKTVLPHRAEAKIDMRLVPDMTAADTLAKLKAHLAKHGFADIDVQLGGGYDPTTTEASSKLIQLQLATYRKLGLEPNLWPRSAGSWPGCVFTGAPVNLPAGHYGLGNGYGAHAPDEYYLIDSTNPKVQGLDGAVASFVEYLYAWA